MRKPQEILAEISEKGDAAWNAIIDPWILEIFHKHRFSTKEFLALDKERRRYLSRLGYFYYHIARPYVENDAEERDELRIVAMASLMETMMSEEPYLDFMAWCEKEVRGNGHLGDFADLKKRYLKKFGLTGKVRNYFNMYFSDEDRDEILRGISIYDKAKGAKRPAKKMRPVKNMEEVADIFYKMRSEFVHASQMRGLRPSGARLALRSVAGTYVTTRISIKELMNAFERSFIRFCEEYIGAAETKQPPV